MIADKKGFMGTVKPISLHNMIDRVSPHQRSQMMASVKGKNTRPEMLIRRMLHKEGFRFRIHRKDLPGNPNIVLPKHNALILVNGCFWHGHTCNRSTLPKTNTSFWEEKIEKNVARDKNNISKLLAEGWRVCVIWECAVKPKKALDANQVSLRISSWIKSKNNYYEIPAPIDGHSTHCKALVD